MVKKQIICRYLCFSLFGLLTISHAAFSDDIASDQDDLEWEEDWDEEGSDWSHSYFMELGYGLRLQEEVFHEQKETLSDIRFQYENEYFADNFDFSSRFDVLYDGVSSDWDLDTRELLFSFSRGNYDIKLGRQVITWGTGDLVFLNDPFPKDFESFYRGRDEDYNKAPSNSLRLLGYFDFANIDLVWTPVFTPDRRIEDEISVFPDDGPNFEDIPDPLSISKTFENGEFAARIFKSYRNSTYEMYLYRGFNKQPNIMVEDETGRLMPTYSRKTSYGFSARTEVWGSLFNFEMSYHDIDSDEEAVINFGTPFPAVSHWRWLVGIERELIPNLTVSAQYYLEYIPSHDSFPISTPRRPGRPPPLSEPSPQRPLNLDIPNQTRDYISTRLTYTMNQEKTTLSMVGIYSPSDEDYYFRASVDYRVSDKQQWSIGVNIFDGPGGNTAFSRLEDDSNVFVRVRYYF